MDKIYIIGHKNPDADSICSAIAYANLKKSLGFNNYYPARCGNTNARIDKILAKFDTNLPEFIPDIRLRAGSIMKTDFLFAKKNSSCYEVMDILDKYDIRALPILNEDKTLCGEISIFDVGEFFIPRPQHPKQIRHVKASLKDIIATLKANALCLFDEEKLDELFVRVGAMEVSTFGSFIETEHIPPEQSLIVVGDRYDIQIKAIQMGVRAIAITGEHQIDKYVLEMAKSKKVSVFESPYDSATTSLLIRMATRVDKLIRQDVEVVGKDFLLSKINLKQSKFYSSLFCVCNSDSTVAGIFSSSDLLNLPKPKIVLVDHNELSQSVNGADEAEILEVIDHHRLGSFSSQLPMLFLNKPVGSTCTIISELYRKENITPSKNIAGILMSGIITDTLNLQSPTTTINDKEEIEYLANISKIDTNQLYNFLFSSDSIIVSSTAKEVINSDCKTYENGDFTFSISQIEDIGFANFLKKLDELTITLEEQRKQMKLSFATLFVTNVNTQNSLLLICSSDEFKAKIDFPKYKQTNLYDLQSIVSRKKQLLPYLLNILKHI